jgi:regulatory protein
MRAGFEEEEVAAALEDLEEVGLIDDERFARELAAHELRRRGSGRRLAISAIRRAGVSAEVAERVVDETVTTDEESRAEDLARTRLSRLSGLDESTAHRRLLSFLLRRGYDGNVARAAARRALGAVAPPD